MELIDKEVHKKKRRVTKEATQLVFTLLWCGGVVRFSRRNAERWH